MSLSQHEFERVMVEINGGTAAQDLHHEEALISTVKAALGKAINALAEHSADWLPQTEHGRQLRDQIGQVGKRLIELQEELEREQADYKEYSAEVGLGCGRGLWVQGKRISDLKDRLEEEGRRWHSLWAEVAAMIAVRPREIEVPSSQEWTAAYLIYPAWSFLSAYEPILESRTKCLVALDAWQECLSRQTTDTSPTEPANGPKTNA